jgi:hypothetical protein
MLERQLAVPSRLGVCPDGLNQDRLPAYKDVARTWLGLGTELPGLVGFHAENPLHVGAGEPTAHSCLSTGLTQSWFLSTVVEPAFLP